MDLAMDTRRSSNWLRRGGHLIRHKPLGALGLFIVILFSLIALLAPMLAPFDPLALNATKLLARPDAVNLLGTDEYGRDVLSRLIWGARVSLYVGITAVALGSLVGGLLGLLSGFYGGAIDFVVQRLTDVLMSFPTLILALAMVAMLGADLNNVVIAIAAVIMPSACRVVRSTVLSVRQNTYVSAARSLGFSDARILFRHVLPNCMTALLVLVTASIGSAILTEAALSFLGLGVPAPAPSWGGMLSGKSQSYMREAPWLVLVPGGAITLVVFGFNFMGDAIRDLLDPSQSIRS